MYAGKVKSTVMQGGSSYGLCLEAGRQKVNLEADGFVLLVLSTWFPMMFDNLPLY